MNEISQRRYGFRIPGDGHEVEKSMRERYLAGGKRISAQKRPQSARRSPPRWWLREAQRGAARLRGRRWASGVEALKDQKPRRGSGSEDSNGPPSGRKPCSRGALNSDGFGRSGDGDPNGKRVRAWKRVPIDGGGNL